MAFNGLNLTPIGGNSRSGIETERNAPMGWAYSSETDSVSDVLTAGYFDSINKIVAADQFIYSSLTDNNVIFTIQSVDRILQQVVLSNSYMQPVPDGIVTANPQDGVEDNLPSFSGDSALVIKDSGFSANDLQVPPDNVIPVYTEVDYGTSVSGLITLGNQKNYSLYKAIVLVSRLQTDSLLAEASNEFESTYDGANALLYRGAPFPSPVASTLLTSTNNFQTNFTSLTIFDVSNDFPPTTDTKGIHTFADVDGTDVENSSIYIEKLILRNFASGGVFSNHDNLVIRTFGVVNSGGITFENVRSATLNAGNFINEAPGVAGDVLLSVTGREDGFHTYSDIVFRALDGEACVFIDPDIGADYEVIIKDAQARLSGTAEFFKSGDTGTITLFGDNTSTGSVTVVVDNGDGTVTVTTNAAHGLVVLQDVTLSAMSVASYDGTISEVLSTPTTTTYTAKQTFFGTATGTWTANSVTVTSATHGLSDGQSLLIEDTLAYNGGDTIYNTTVNTFDINRVFATAETSGQWNTGSLTQRDRRVTTRNVEGIPDSQSIASFTIDAVASSFTTVITLANTYQDMNFTGQTALLDGTELFTLIDTDNGTFRYDGLSAQTFNISGFITAEKIGATVVNYLFAPFISTDGGATFARETDVGQSLASMTNQPLSVPFAGAIVLVPGEQFKYQVECVDNTNSIVTSTFNFNLT